MPENRFLQIDKDSFSYIYMQNVDIPLKTYETGLLRCNVYLPKDAAPFGTKKYPVIATYGPYGKEVPYEVFFKRSWDQLNPSMKSTHSAWETPDPAWWTSNGYIYVRTDERGSGQSPGLLDTMSRGTSEAFFDVVEWCSEQEWSTGKVGLLGISYYAGGQWRVAARRPKGLAAIIPWEGMSDYYRDRVRHGGILSNQFIAFFMENAILPNQYGKPGRGDRKWGQDTLEGDLDEETLKKNIRDQREDTLVNKYLDDEYFSSRDYDLETIEVPLLSVANWGGILLHLRGNIHGFMRAGSKYKFLRAVVGRHDLPFYYQESAEMQRSFFNCFLKGDDADGWKSGKQPRVRLLIRKGNSGFNDPQRELIFKPRDEVDWPLPDTKYTKFFLTADHKLAAKPDPVEGAVSYDAMNGEPITFTYVAPKETEITGHSVARLTVSCAQGDLASQAPSDIDLFLTLRKFGRDGNEVYFTGTMGDPAPIVKGWQRVSLRKVNDKHPLHREYLPWRDYASIDVQSVVEKEEYQVDVEIWATSVVLEEGESLVFEVAGHDTQGSGSFIHDHPEDRKPEIFDGVNTVHVGRESSYVLLPIIENS